MKNNISLSIFIMLRKNILLLLSITGIIWSIIFAFTTGVEANAPSSNLATPHISPFEYNIAGIGFVEASSRNMSIGSFAPGIVSKVMVTEGDKVSAGETIFTLDQRSAKAEVQNKLHSLARGKAALKLSQINLSDAQDSLKRAQGLKSGRSISQEDLQKRYFAVERAQADTTIKNTIIDQSEAELQLAKIDLEKTMINSPIDGIILKVRITPGEFISGNEQDQNSPILLGKIHPLYLRVQIDENDIWRFEKQLKAYAFLRSNSNIKIPLSFVRVEPYALQKGSLAENRTELIDTRVIEIIYQINYDTDNIYIGQHLDVFIETNTSL